jgi:hypothetical protein
MFRRQLLLPVLLPFSSAPYLHEPSESEISSAARLQS